MSSRAARARRRLFCVTWRPTHDQTPSLCKHRTLRSSGKRSLATNLRWFSAAWVLCLVIFSLQPLRFTGTRNGTWTHLIAHAIAFGVPALLLARARLSSGWVLLICALSLAGGIEMAQHLIYRNPFEWHDLIADVLGTVLGILPGTLYRRGT